MQGGILDIQAKEETNNTQPTNKKPAIEGGKQKEGGGQSTTHTTHTSHTEEERRGARRQQRTERERTHTHQKGFERALAGSKKGPRIIR